MPRPPAAKVPMRVREPSALRWNATTAFPSTAFVSVYTAPPRSVSLAYPSGTRLEETARAFSESGAVGAGASAQAASAALTNVSDSVERIIPVSCIGRVLHLKGIEKCAKCAGHNPSDATAHPRCSIHSLTTLSGSGERVARRPERGAEQQDVLDDESTGAGRHEEAVHHSPRPGRRYEKAQCGQEHQRGTDATHRGSAPGQWPRRQEERDHDLGETDHVRRASHVGHEVQPRQKRTVGDERLDALRLRRGELEQAKPEDDDRQTVSQENTTASQ